MSYQEWQVKRSPPWLRGTWGSRLIRQLGHVKDDALERARYAILARFPTLGPEDAVSALGEERGLVRGPTELAADYAERVRCAWDAWQYAGSAYGLLTQVWKAGLGRPYLIQDNGRVVQLDATGTQVISTTGIHAERGRVGWQFDWSVCGYSQRNTFWSRFCLLYDDAAIGTIWQTYPAGPTFVSGVTMHVVNPAVTPLRGTTVALTVTTSGVPGGALRVSLFLNYGRSPTATYWDVATAAPGVSWPLPTDVFNSNLALTWPTGTFYVDDTIWGGVDYYPVRGQGALLNSLVRKWKPGRTQYVGAYLLEQGNSWGWPVRTWGDNPNWQTATLTLIAP